MIRTALVTATLLAAGALVTPPAGARDIGHAVGTWYVLELADLVSARAGGGTRTVAFESMGTSAAVQAFCAGSGDAHPDILGLPRALTDAETGQCAANGVTGIHSVPLALDALVLAQGRGQEPVAASAAELYRALAAEVPVDGRIVANTARRWREVGPTLPDLSIALMAGGPGSADRALFAERVLLPGCLTFPAVAALPEERRRAVCTTVREDLVFPEPGAGDAAGRALAGRPGALGLVNLAFAGLNTARLQSLPLGGVAPTPETIADGRYPLTRTLTLHIKAGGAAGNPGLAAFLAELQPGRALGRDGWLAGLGVIAPAGP